MKYYIARNGNPAGPFDLDRLADEGVTPDTLLWCQGMSRWTRACEIAEVMDTLNGVHSPAPEEQMPGIPLPPVFDPERYRGVNGFTPAPEKPAREFRHRPDNYMAEAILVCLLCCLVTGIIAIVNASKVNSLYDSGDFDRAEAASKSARNWVIGSVIAGVVFWFFILQFTFITHVTSSIIS